MRVPKCANNDGSREDHESSVVADRKALPCRTLRTVGAPFWTTFPLLLEIAEMQMWWAVITSNWLDSQLRLLPIAASHQHRGGIDAIHLAAQRQELKKPAASICLSTALTVKSTALAPPTRSTNRAARAFCMHGYRTHHNSPRCCISGYIYMVCCIRLLYYRLLSVSLSSSLPLSLALTREQP
jgi:hypothetical protein